MWSAELIHRGAPSGSMLAASAESPATAASELVKSKRTRVQRRLCSSILLSCAVGRRGPEGGRKCVSGGYRNGATWTGGDRIERNLPRPTRTPCSGACTRSPRRRRAAGTSRAPTSTGRGSASGRSRAAGCAGAAWSTSCHAAAGIMPQRRSCGSVGRESVGVSLWPTPDMKHETIQTSI